MNEWMNSFIYFLFTEVFIKFIKIFINVK
jgi:hypothetical protein